MRKEREDGAVEASGRERERERKREIMVAREVPKMSRVLRKVHDLP